MFEKLLKCKESIFQILDIFENIENTKTFKFIINEMKKNKENFKDEKSLNNNSSILDYDQYSIKEEINSLLEEDKKKIYSTEIKRIC